MDNINADRNNLSEAIQSLQTEVQQLQHELHVSEEKMQMIVQYPDDKERLGGEGEYCDIFVKLASTTASFHWLSKRRGKRREFRTDRAIRC